MGYDKDNATVKNAVEQLKSENIILAKCDSNDALKWGLSYGIHIFQGPLVDEIEIALIRKNCPKANKCTLVECLKRRRLLQGMFRDECAHKEILEKIL